MELGPGPLAVVVRPAPGRSSRSRRSRRCATRTRTIDDTAYTLLAFGRGWAAGVDVDLDRFAGDGPAPLRLPGYAVPHESVTGSSPAPGRASRRRSPRPTAAAPAARSPAVRRRPAIADLADCVLGADVGRAGAVGSPRPRRRPVARRRRRRPTRSSPRSPASSPRTWSVAVEVTAVAASGASLTAARSVVLVGPTDELRRRRRALADDGVGRGPGARRRRGRRRRCSPPSPAAPPTPAAGRRTRSTRWRSGIVGTAPREYLDLRTALVDLDRVGQRRRSTPRPSSASCSAAPTGSSPTAAAAARADDRARLRVGPAPATRPTFRRGGNYLVTGGLGGVGFALARHLAADHEANLVVVASRPVPEGAERERVARPPRLRRPDEPAHPPARRARVARHEGHRRRRRPRRPGRRSRDAVDEAERRVGRARRRHPRRRRAARPADRAGDARGPRGRRRRQGPRRARPRRRAAPPRRRAARARSRRRPPCSTPTARPPTSPPTACSTRSPASTATCASRTINYGLWAELGIAADAAHRGRLGIETGDPVDHPVLSERARERDGTVRVVGTLATEHHWVVDEHRTTDRHRTAPGHRPPRAVPRRPPSSPGLDGTALGPVTLLEPLVVPDGVPVTVRVTRRRPATDAHRAQLESDGGVGSWRLHSEAELVRGEPADVATACCRPRPPDGDRRRPARPAAVQLELGPRWSSVVEAWRDGDVGRRVASRLADAVPRRARRLARPPGPRRRGDGVRRRARRARATSLYVPVGYDARPPLRPSSPPAPWVRARRARVARRDELLRVDLTSATTTARSLLSIDGLALRPIDEPAALAVDRADARRRRRDGAPPRRAARRPRRGARHPRRRGRRAARAAAGQRTRRG